ncbi:MAG TPA: pitrilysin family protein, partial [Candidatus Binataceae bacterium]|nr:pitrilysin family protein [Candidatus Binataceae bacterium]
MKIIFSRYYRIARLIPLLIACLTAASGSARAGMTDAVKTQTLPNGLRVIVLENHKAAVASFNVFYRVGARNEQFGKTGISHLIEHLMFKGTHKLGPEEFSKVIQANGGEDNAMTSADYTEYFENINRDRLSVPISLESDRMANFAPQEFDKERAVVAEERRLRTDDQPEDALDEQVRAAAFVEHPYHWPVIGWMQDIQRLTLADARAYHEIYYSPRNAIIVVVGDFNADQVLKQISEAFGSIKNGPMPPPMPEVEPEQKGERRIELRHAANLPAFEEAYHVPNLTSPDAFPLEIASE